MGPSALPAAVGTFRPTASQPVLVEVERFCGMNFQPRDLSGTSDTDLEVHATEAVARSPSAVEKKKAIALRGPRPASRVCL